jgi:Syntaxin-like protein
MSITNKKIIYYILFLFQRVLKLQRERLLNEFTAALNSFQSLQREAAQKEKDEVKRVRSGSGLAGPPGSRDNALVLLDDNETQQYRAPQRQMQTFDDDVDVQALEERERAIRQLEVSIVYTRGKYTISHEIFSR